ncbi:hypothetical protein Q1695_003337 [Nippostrongylus brasiliensis]|nr:hypothetical protein Q1695_003337 [Nippostrongylus brasiliensis]
MPLDDMTNNTIVVERHLWILDWHSQPSVPLLIYANKQDLPDALTPEEIEKALDLQKIRDRQWYVQPSCAVTGVGLGEGLDWLQATIAASKCSEPSRQVDMFVMFFIMLLLTIFLPSEQNVKEKEFVGAEHWDDEFLKQCSEPSARYGGTVFPTLKQTVVAAPGDAVFWTNMDYSGAKDEDSIHGACPVYDGVKVATVLWIHTKEQAIFLSSVENKLFDLDRLVGTKASHNLGLCKLKENSQA